MSDEKNLALKTKQLRNRLNSLVNMGASDEDVYVASVELDNCIDKYFELNTNK